MERMTLDRGGRLYYTKLGRRFESKFWRRAGARNPASMAAPETAGARMAQAIVLETSCVRDYDRRLAA